VSEKRSSVTLSKLLRNEGQHIETLSYALWSLRRNVLAGHLMDTKTQNGDILHALSQLGALELQRALQAAGLAQELALDEDAPLLELAQALTEPWQAPLLSHHVALSTAVAEVDALTAEISHHLLIANPTRHGLADQLIHAVPRSLVWFLRAPAGIRSTT
jgi:hypothetical protein